MDAADLRLFATVARLGGMGRAAAVLNTVQSNVTARVRLMEAELGVALFHRHSRGVTLTDAGQRLLPYADRIGALLQEARRAVADDGTPAGSLTLGSLETAAALRLPPILAAFARAHPAVDLTLRTGTTAALVADVLERRLEGAFVAGPVQHPDLAEDAMFIEEMVLVTAPSVRLWDDVLARRDLKIVVFRAGCSYRARLEAMLAARGVVGVRCVEFGTLEGILGCVAADIGITLLPRGVLGPGARGVELGVHALPPAEAEATTMFVRRRDGYVSAALTAFLGLARPARQRAAAA
jgi:DNA-binding transcriptional LysR family regulator